MDSKLPASYTSFWPLHHIRTTIRRFPAHIESYPVENQQCPGNGIKTWTSHLLSLLICATQSHILYSISYAQLQTTDSTPILLEYPDVRLRYPSTFQPCREEPTDIGMDKTQIVFPSYIAKIWVLPLHACLGYPIHTGSPSSYVPKATSSLAPRLFPRRHFLRIFPRLHVTSCSPSRHACTGFSYLILLLFISLVRANLVARRWVGADF